MKLAIKNSFAVIQMIAQWNNNPSLTEEALFNEHGKIVTSTGRAFAYGVFEKNTVFILES